MQDCGLKRGRVIFHYFANYRETACAILINSRNQLMRVLIKIHLMGSKYLKSVQKFTRKLELKSGRIPNLFPNMISMASE